MNLHWSGGIGSGTDWSNRPKYNSYSTSATFGRAYNPDLCPSNGTRVHGFNVLTPIKADAAGHAGSFTATLSEDSHRVRPQRPRVLPLLPQPHAGDLLQHRRRSVPAASAMSAVAGADDAACDTTAPYPFMGKTIATTPPVLKAKVSDKDGDKLQATFQYWVDGPTTKATGKSGDNLASGSYRQLQPPRGFVSSLTNGKTVDWQAEVTDGEDSTSFTEFTDLSLHGRTDRAFGPPPSPRRTTSSPTPTPAEEPAPSTAPPVRFDLATSGTTAATKFVYAVDVPPATSNPPAAQTVTAHRKRRQDHPSPPPLPARTPCGSMRWTPPATTPVHRLPLPCHRRPGHHLLQPGRVLQQHRHQLRHQPGSGRHRRSGDSFSATDLANAGWASGGKVTVDGAAFTLPAFGAGQKDNVLAANQTVTYNGSGTALEFLATSTFATLVTPGAINGDSTAPYVPAGSTVVRLLLLPGHRPDRTLRGHGHHPLHRRQQQVLRPDRAELVGRRQLHRRSRAAAPQ